MADEGRNTLRENEVMSLTALSHEITDVKEHVDKQCNDMQKQIDELIAEGKASNAEVSRITALIAGLEDNIDVILTSMSQLMTKVETNSDGLNEHARVIKLDRENIEKLDNYVKKLGALWTEIKTEITKLQTDTVKADRDRWKSIAKIAVGAVIAGVTCYGNNITNAWDFIKQLFSLAF